MARNYNKRSSNPATDQIKGSEHSGGGLTGFVNDLIGGAFFGNEDFASDFWDEISGYNSQMREFEQQEYLQDKMNEYNTPAQQLQRMKEAGINPNLAVQSIVGNASESAQAPAVASDTGGASSALQSVGGAASVVGNLANNAAQRENLNAQTRHLNSQSDTEDALREARKNEIIQRTAESLSKLKVNEATAEGLGISNTYITREKEAELALRWANHDKIRMDIQLIEKQVDTEIASYQKLLDEHDLLRGQIGEQEWLTKQAEYKAKMDELSLEKQNKMMEYFRSIGFDPSDPIDNALIQAFLSGSDPSAILKAMRESKYSQFSGQYAAEQTYAYSITNAKEMAKSLNQIITDWNQPATNLYSLLDKSFNITSNGDNNTKINNVTAARDNTEAYSRYAQLVVSLNLQLDDLNNQINAASAKNDFKSVSNLTKQREGLRRFLQTLSFDKFIESGQ